MRTPSIKTLSRVFEDPKQAKRILQMSRAELSSLPAGAARIRECYNPPKWWDVRLHCLDAIDPGLFGLEGMPSSDGDYASYLNAGDTYNDTIIYWRGIYRVQSIGDFVETLECQSVYFS